MFVHSNQPIWFLGRVRPSPLIWAGSGPFQKNLKNKYFSIFVISPRVLFYAVLFNLSLFFVILKK